MALAKRYETQGRALIIALDNTCGVDTLAKAIGRRYDLVQASDKGTSFGSISGERYLILLRTSQARNDECDKNRAGIYGDNAPYVKKDVMKRSRANFLEGPRHLPYSPLHKNHLPKDFIRSKISVFVT